MNKITKFFECIFDVVFSGFVIALVLLGSFIFMLYVAVEETENHNKAERQSQTAMCYSQGMVLVNTDAGARCVLPANLTLPVATPVVGK